MNWLKRLFGTAEQPAALTHPARPAPAPDLRNFPFPLVAVPGATAEQEWRKHQARWRAEGGSAVVVGDANDVQQLIESMEFNDQPMQGILQSATEESAEEFFAERTKEYGADSLSVPEDEWPTGRVPPITLSAHLEVLGRRPKPTVYLAHLPTSKPWEIPAYLKFGGWNECPAPEDHVSVLRHWAEKYQIEVYAMTSDVLECTVARPPRSREAAMALAREQFLYCTDNVYQGTESLSLLGASLQNSRAWYFWWD